MNEYNFILTFSLPAADEDPSRYEAALEKNDCTDALLGISKNGIIALDFTREATSGLEAIFSAISAVERSIPDSSLIEIEPDFVGITDIAEIVSRSRQNIRKLIYAADSGCPAPVHNGSSAIWHLYDVLKWLATGKDYEIDGELLEVAQIAKAINAQIAWNQVEAGIRHKVRHRSATGNSQPMPALTS